MINFDTAQQKFINFLKKNDRSTSTVTAYSKDIEQLIKHLTVNQNVLDIKNVTTENLINYTGDLKIEGLTNKTISRKINSTKSFFKFLTNKNLLKFNPADNVQHPKFVNKPPRILTKIEYKALRDVVKTNIRTRAMVEVLLQTGIRISELVEITIPDIIFTPTNLLLVKGIHGERTIPLNDTCVSAIRDYLEIRPKVKGDYFLVSKSGKKLLIRNVRATLDKALSEIDLQSVKVNDLRHTFIAYQLQMGSPIEVVSEIAGHKRLSTTEKYLQYITPNQKQDISIKEL